MKDNWKENHWNLGLGILTIIVGIIPILNPEFRVTGILIILVLLTYLLIDYYKNKINHNELEIKKLKEDIGMFRRVHDIEYRLNLIENRKRLKYESNWRN